MTKVVKTPVVAKTPASSHGPALPLAGAILPLLAAFSCAVDANPDVTLYGTVDLGLSFQRYSGDVTTPFDAGSSFGMTSGE